MIVRRLGPNMRTAALVANLFGSGSVAVDIDHFSNNLASDLEPLLSLLGDSMTKQFLSDSTTFLDYIIFAVAPIGIITAVVSAVRLCGSTALRAFIGRSQRGQGQSKRSFARRLAVICASHSHAAA